MAIYAISDLHLAISTPDKSMELFGKEWENYQSRIKENWEKTVNDTDTVIVAGDISWALDLEEAYDDFAYLNSLPGTKIILKGNHDLYFSTISKMEAFLQKNNFNTIKILHNNSFFIEDTNICGTRLWANTEDEKADDKKIFKRELLRLKLSLDSIEPANKDKNTIVAVHFPPFRDEVTKILREYNVKTVVYGHLHGQGHYMIKEGVINDIDYKMVSGDHTRFTVIKLN